MLYTRNIVRLLRRSEKSAFLSFQESVTLNGRWITSNFQLRRECHQPIVRLSSPAWPLVPVAGGRRRRVESLQKEEGEDDDGE